MYTGRTYKLSHLVVWRRHTIIIFALWSAFVTVLYKIMHFHWVAIPWLPVALLGTAVTFIVSFKNNASYGRLWEARKIWGAIVNDSRSWGIMARDFVTDHEAQSPILEADLKAIHKRLLYRHMAWLTALRYQLRQSRGWENMSARVNAQYRKRYFRVPEYNDDLTQQLSNYLSESELEKILLKSNRATHLISLQSNDLKALFGKGLIDNFRHVELQKMLANLYTHQGKCERIKNFPYPRQFATLNLFFTSLFVFLLPFGLLTEFNELGGNFIWLNVAFSTLISWVFFTLEKVGEASENPFEGGANDTPMCALSRTIEIDLREMLDEDKNDIPRPIEPENEILM